MPPTCVAVAKHHAYKSKGIPIVRRSTSPTDPPHQIGFVWLIGAGPGDPELITLKAVRALKNADVVLYDALVNHDLLEYCPPHCQRIYVGKREGRHTLPQEEINAQLIELARKHSKIVRLKGGDPFVFGRGGEEALALAEAGIPFDVVPGISAGISVPSAAMIPVTHRGVATEVTFVTGHLAKDGIGFQERWEHLAKTPGTLVIFMALTALDEITRALIAGGQSPDRPTALIANGTTPTQTIVVGTLSTISSLVKSSKVSPPALCVVGEVVNLSSQLRPMFESAEPNS